MAFYNENGSYAYDYRDPDYSGIRVAGGHLRALPEQHCQKNSGRRKLSSYVNYTMKFTNSKLKTGNTISIGRDNTGLNTQMILACSFLAQTIGLLRSSALLLPSACTSTTDSLNPLTKTLKTLASMNGACAITT